MYTSHTAASPFPFLDVAAPDCPCCSDELLVLGEAACRAYRLLLLRDEEPLEIKCYCYNTLQMCCVPV